MTLWQAFGVGLVAGIPLGPVLERRVNVRRRWQRRWMPPHTCRRCWATYRSRVELVDHTNVCPFPVRGERR